ncbi:pyridoxal phosphate-dependent aminotransferase [Phycicoccus sp. BSK3Z-2]|uniref:Pyridoxal phosphate-dependent aminotransferase n=1 Tax=Phycicoccus avicenniae TaxID=2828860 RepID=A0A941DAC3_9MICO|nr:pyridoxal phosphate-dependent aminotransferase [Phycicoccus avicenniae]MBR7742767.1 pyridoxal phosphate-dependent aminotransferase [Phycicoccus avicenniae]
MPSSPGHPALADFGTTIFATMTQMALEKDAINLGQGFPDTDGPPEVLAAAVEAITEGRNQYPPGRGVPELRRAIAAHQERFYGLTPDPDTEVLVTVGATEAIAVAMLALVRPGDEVVMFEPYYDSYAATVALAGGTRRTSVLRFPDLAVDEASLRAAFSDRTRVVLLNTPHNPTGKVFTREELELVAELAREHDAWVVTDEVYEHLTFDGARHVPMATLPGMVDRTVTIGSGGKTFSATGWKVGWLTGPAEVVSPAVSLKQFLTFVGSGPFQPAVALGLGLEDAVFDGMAARLAGQRDRLVAGLRDAGFEVPVPQGGYFALADASPLGVTDAVSFCLELPDRAGVVGVPASAFHDDPEAGRTVVRFAFCKKDEVLDEGVRRLRTLRATG